MPADSSSKGLALPCLFASNCMFLPDRNRKQLGNASHSQVSSRPKQTRRLHNKNHPCCTETQHKETAWDGKYLRGYFLPSSYTQGHQTAESHVFPTASLIGMLKHEGWEHHSRQEGTPWTQKLGKVHTRAPTSSH